VLDWLELDNTYSLLLLVISSHMRCFTFFTAQYFSEAVSVYVEKKTKFDYT